MPTSPNVYVFDNFVGTSIVDRVWEVLDNPIWQFGWHSTKTAQESRFWNTRFMGSKGVTPTTEQIRNFYFEYPPIADLWIDIKEEITNRLNVPIDLMRVYGNAYTHGTGGAMHRDDGIWTCLYYGTPEWDPSWRGETIFFDNNKHIVDVAEYIPGRFVIFPAKMYHQAGDVTKTCNALRTIVAFKCN